MRKRPKRRVLLAGTDARWVEALRLALSADYSCELVSCVSTVSACVQSCLSASPGLILTSVELEDADATSLCKQLRSQPVSVLLYGPAILKDSLGTHDAIAEGAFHYLAVPVDPGASTEWKLTLGRVLNTIFP